MAKRLSRSEEEIDLTQSLRRLAVEEIAQENESSGSAAEHSALLFCRDSAAQKWAPRWLQQAGFESTIRRDAKDGAAIARDSSFDVVIVEAGLRGESGEPLYADLIADSQVQSPVIVLCANGKEVSAALDAGADDVVRKPVEWRLVGVRAQHAVRRARARHELVKARTAAGKALDLADSARQQLRSRESFEPVTGLPTKTKFMDLVKRGMQAVERDGNDLAVFVIGFTRFRLVIEAMGQERADLVLNEIGFRLSDCLRDAQPEDSRDGGGIWTAAAGNLDGPRFGVMLTCARDGGRLSDMQERLLATLSKPVQVAAQIVHLSACIGVALYPQDADEADRLVQRAENAMRDAQSHGGGFRHYCEQTDAAAAGKLRMEHMLHEALDRSELCVAYQPISSIAGNEVVAAEALLRWPQPDGSFISPDIFAPIAEESGLMIRIGEYVLDTACGQLAQWREMGLPLRQMCVNVSKVQLLSSGFVKTVGDVLARHGLPPEALELELSERGVLSTTADVIGSLHALRELGVRLSIDDFGTGDSAIKYLKELPVDCLKIDRSYIRGMLGDSKDAAIISAMVALGQRLDLAVIAEGVETPEQLAQLERLECDLYQGFIVSTAVYADKFLKLLGAAD